MPTFKDRFIMLHEESDLNQEEFGNLFGASKAQVYNWRSQRGEPDTEMLKAIATSCNVSVDWLVGNGDIRVPLADKKAFEIIEEFQEFIQQKYQSNQSR